MSCLERRFNIRAAIIAPSILFGALHIIGNDLKPLSAIQLLAAGSIVGIMFSLIVYESGSVWNSAVIHVIWNIMIAGGILHIGSGARVDSLFNFTLNSRSSLITGGDFGAEASVIAIAVYLIFCALAIFLKSGARRGRLA